MTRTKRPAPPKKTKPTLYRITWTDPAAGAAYAIAIRHTREYLVKGTDHVEVESVKPAKAPLPITDTGYRSHFMPALELINAGGPVTFVTAWLDREAKGSEWRKKASARAQGDLFQWADTAGEATARPKRTARRPAPRRASALRKDRRP